MKNLNKIIEKTEFLVQKRIGGWPGWNIYARHPKWSKWSTVIEQDKKPILTKQLKEKVVKAAIEESENWKHNQPIWQKLTSVSTYMTEYTYDFGYIFLRDKQVQEIVIKALENECEHLKVNEALQRLLDAKERYEKYCELKNSLKPTKIKIK